MREFSVRVVIAIVSLLVIGRFHALAAERPNFLFVVTDDQGPWAMGCAGDPNALTPNMDRLRAEGALLTRCYTPTPVCSPARVSILTSRYGSELGITDFLPRSHEDLPGLTADTPTWPSELAKAGYSTALIGKYHCGAMPESHPTKIGYQEFRGFIHGGMVSQDPVIEVNGRERTIEGWTPDVLTDFALDYIRRHRDGPFALSLHFWAPHANAGTNAEGDRTWLPLSDADLSPFRMLDPLLPEPDYPDLDTDRTKRMLREYLGSVHSVDRNLGRVLDLLDELNLAENTVVIFSADHGYNLGHHGIWHKGNGRWLLKHDQGPRANMWEQSLRVPAIVKWPQEIKANSTVNQTISHLDWFPTLLAMAGAELPVATLRGRNVLRLLKGQPFDRDEEFMAQYRMREDHGDGAD
ncbi:MAG: sulfatase-like hydrolase/transferase, partial [Planctomycetaceae bacterium]|nr:sulfatase-like hydrolase/transferase [Planctomycetaceae bacterium]